MNYLKRSLFVAACTAVWGGCSDAKKPVSPAPEYEVISFEPSERMVDPAGGIVTLGDAELEGAVSGGKFRNLYWTKSFADYEKYLTEGVFNARLFGTASGTAWFGSHWSHSEYGDYWSGFVLSATYDASPKGYDYANQFTVQAQAGANGSSVCAVGFVDNYTGRYAVPTVDLTPARTVGYCHIAPSAMLGGYEPIEVPKAELWYKVVVTGHLGDAKTGSIECLLTEGGVTKSGWTKVDLSALGRVDKLTFAIDSNDTGAYGVNAPAFFGLDEIGLLVER